MWILPTLSLGLRTPSPNNHRMVLTGRSASLKRLSAGHQALNSPSKKFSTSSWNTSYYPPNAHIHIHHTTPFFKFTMQVWGHWWLKIKNKQTNKKLFTTSIASRDNASFKKSFGLTSLVILCNSNVICPPHVIYFSLSLVPEKKFVAIDAFECFVSSEDKTDIKLVCFSLWGQRECPRYELVFLRCLLVSPFFAPFMVFVPFLSLIITVPIVFSLGSLLNPFGTNQRKFKGSK